MSDWNDRWKGLGIGSAHEADYERAEGGFPGASANSGLKVAGKHLTWGRTALEPPTPPFHVGSAVPPLIEQYALIKPFTFPANFDPADWDPEAAEVIATTLNPKTALVAMRCAHLIMCYFIDSADGDHYIKALPGAGQGDEGKGYRESGLSIINPGFVLFPSWGSIATTKDIDKIVGLNGWEDSQWTMSLPVNWAILYGAEGSELPASIEDIIQTWMPCWYTRPFFGSHEWDLEYAYKFDNIARAYLFLVQQSLNLYAEELGVDHVAEFQAMEIAMQSANRVYQNWPKWWVDM
jgi:hypothetical protein